MEMEGEKLILHSWFCPAMPCSQGQAAVVFLATKGGLTPTLPIFRWIASKVIFLPLTFPSGDILAWVSEMYVHVHMHTDKWHSYTSKAHG